MKRFKKYVSGFDFSNEKIRIKYKHSFSVRKLMKCFSKKLKLNKEEQKLAGFIGLYHDIGRFNQVSEFNTFKDYKSFDHGDVGYEILKNGEFLKDFNKKEQKIILKSVKNHNKYKISLFMNKKELFYSKLIRDADKIDILKRIAKGKILDYNKLNCEVSEDIEKEFYKCNLLKSMTLKNTDDYLLRDLAFVFDLNFKESYEYLYKKKYINKMYKKVENKDYYQKYFDKVNEFVENRRIVC